MVFDVRDGKQINVASDLFPNPYEPPPIKWRSDSASFTFEYNQRGHQLYRVIEVSGTTGAARSVISELQQITYSGKKIAMTCQMAKK